MADDGADAMVDDEPQARGGGADVDTSDGKKKGRGHRDASDMEERYMGKRFQELDAAAAAGPLASVEGWVVFVTGVHEEAQEEDIHEAFAEFGEISNIYMNLDRQTGFVKGYALIEYRKRAEAQKAIEAMDGQQLLTQDVHVTWAFKKGDVKRPSGSARPGRR